MTSVPQEFVTVEMRGLKAALIARSRGDRVSVSTLVRSFVAHGLGHEVDEPAEPSCEPGSRSFVKLSIRVTTTEALKLANGARAAGLSRPAYLANLIAKPSDVVTGAARAEQLSALVASNAQLSILSRNVRHLTALLSQGSVRAAQEYRAMLDTLCDDVRRHLALSSKQLADLRSWRKPSSSPNPSDPHRSS
ncbi:MAG: hypothetical protein ABI460_20515 [Caldimonas sp.]